MKTKKNPTTTTKGTEQEKIAWTIYFFFNGETIIKICFFLIPVYLVLLLGTRNEVGTILFFMWVLQKHKNSKFVNGQRTNQKQD